MSPVRRLRLGVSMLLLAGCYSPAGNRDWADRAAYGILDKASEQVTGGKREFVVERPVERLRQRLLTAHEPIVLSVVDALDVAAENSRDFQRQKEILYQAALTLTTQLNNFRLRFGGGGGGTVDGLNDQATDVRLTDDLSAAANTTAGTRLVFGFVQNFLKSLLGGGNFDGGSILNMTLTQPLLRGAGQHIAREPLTQAERDVIYAMRSFERFRSQFANDLIAAYWRVVNQSADFKNVEANYQSLYLSRLQIEELYNSGRRTIVDLGRAQQAEYAADAQRVQAKNNLQTSLDQFKLTLGLPVTAQIEVDPDELGRLSEIGVQPIELTPQQVVDLALRRRFDYRTAIDQVEDQGRKTVIAENALELQIDLTGAIDIPSENGRGPNIDWSKVGWSAGIDVDLLLDRIPLRNAYRNQLIVFDQVMRAREQLGDQLTANVRSSLRNLQTAIETYKIQLRAVELGEQRVEATTDLYAAGRVQAFDKLQAQNDFVSAQLSRNAAIIAYATARLRLMNDMEAIRLDANGLQFDRSLPLPTSAATE